MILAGIGGTTRQDAEDLAVLASQLAGLGLDVRIDARGLPDPASLGRNLQFDLAPFLTEEAPGPEDLLLLARAETLPDERLLSLRRLGLRGGVRCLATGAFASRQARITASARLAYALGAEPELVDLAAPDALASHGGLPLVGVATAGRARPVPSLLIVAPDLADPGQGAALLSLARSRRLSVSVLTDGKSKERWLAAHGAALPVFHHGEVLPAALAARTDICAVMAPLSSGYRLRALIADLLAGGAILLDGTSGLDWPLAADAFVPGPREIAGLGAFLADEIAPNRQALAAAGRDSRAARRLDPAGWLARIGPGHAARAPAGAVGRPVFMPTNGIGLGHAQRCTLIAGELAAEPMPVFAAFPSCVGLIKAAGFDAMPLIQRSPLHAEAHANDLVSYIRLRALTAGAAALVFDGVYVFDSVFRSIIENRIPGIWIRRGLWPEGQDNSVALDREKVFDRVIVPAEAFAELNEPYSRGARVREVGPIVQQVVLSAAARRAFRDRLAERLERKFDRLLVTLLGAGIAADRSAQVQVAAAAAERRDDLLHLIVVWPTAQVRPAWFGWKHSRVVRTRHVATLAAAADLCIAAAGYNAFHEALYNRIPTLFVPQTAPMMDDQAARAAAAVERGAAAMLRPEQLAMLDREIARLLDGGGADALRRGLAALDLPAPGNAAAARVIEEISDGRQPALAVAHRPRDARRRR